MPFLWCQYRYRFTIHLIYVVLDYNQSVPFLSCPYKPQIIYISKIIGNLFFLTSASLNYLNRRGTSSKQTQVRGHERWIGKTYEIFVCIRTIFHLFIFVPLAFRIVPHYFHVHLKIYIPTVSISIAQDILA